MHTRWSIAFFLFWGLVSVGLMFLPVFSGCADGTRSRIYRFSLLVSAFCGCVAVATVAFSLNSPGNLINILGNPWAGLSSAIIAQIAIILVALIGFFKGSSGQRNLVYGSAGVGIYSLFCLFRMYMISTRPALNSFVLFALLLVLTMELTSLFRLSFCSDSFTGINKQSLLYPFLTIAAGCLLGVFTIRLLLLSNPDRIFTFSGLTNGIYAPFFWSVVVLIFILPTVHAIYSFKKKVTSFSRVVCFIFLFGLFVFCSLVNQMPISASSRFVQ